VPSTVGAVGLDGAAAGAYAIVGDGCTGLALGVGSSCTVGVEFHPVTIGNDVARLRLDADTDLGQHGHALVGMGLAVPPPDTSVNAIGVGVSLTTFYPYKDAYKDTTSVRGTLNEIGTVSVAIYSMSTGHRVLLKSLGPVSGPYGYAWNGRSVSGARQPAGKYRVVQTIRDTIGNIHSWTAYTTISNKRLYLHTVSITRSGATIAALGNGPGGSCRTSTSAYSRGMKLSSGSLYAAVGYSFKLPSATVYRSFKLSVTGRSGARPALVGLQDFAIGSAWVVQNFAPLRWAGTGYGTFSIKVNPPGHHSGRTVRAVVAAQNFSGPVAFDIRSVKLVAVYGILR
jgi:hypothetical protein